MYVGSGRMERQGEERVGVVGERECVGREDGKGGGELLGGDVCGEKGEDTCTWGGVGEGSVGEARV